MDFQVSLDQFEGPLDLMLHLVRKNKLDLFDLDLEKLAGQYCAYLRQAKVLHLEISSEYLEECTILMEYKSRRLLPKKTEQAEEENWQEDPAARLAQRLQEYQRCQQESERLSALFEKRSRQFERSASAMKEEWEKRAREAASHESWPSGSLQPADLLRAMERVLRRHALLQPYQTSVEVRELSVAERMDTLRSRLFHGGTKDRALSFESLCQDCISLHETIVTFLSVLELVHSGEVSCTMDKEDVLWIRANIIR